MMNRRTEKEMMTLILSVAQHDERIRGVIMNGSRTSPSPKKDIFQDYDIVYIVKDAELFVNDLTWIERFGQRLIMQKPDEMDGIWPQCKTKFTYLMQFTDGNRLDLTLFNQDQFNHIKRDSQSILLLDKDNFFEKFSPPSDKDYLPQPPTQTDFANCCNEFYWSLLSIAKGIWRKELTYVKYLFEQIAKNELIKLLSWYAGTNTGFNKTIGKFGKYLQDYLEPELWDSFTRTYVDADYAHLWDGVFEMCTLFHYVALKISTDYRYSYNEEEYQSMVQYLEAVKEKMI